MGISLTYNGVSSSSFVANGKRFLHILTRPTIPGAVEDMELVHIPGRDGALVYREGTFSPIEIPVTFSFKVPPSGWHANINAVYSWLTSKPSDPMLKFSFMDVYYKVLFVRVGELRKVSPSIQQLDVVFQCEALPYLGINESIGPYSLGQSIYPAGRVSGMPVAHPLFLFNVSSSGVVSIQTSKGTFSMTLTSTGTTYVDSDLMTAYRMSGSTKINQSLYASGDYSVLWANSSTTYYFYKPSSSNASATLTIYMRYRGYI